MLSYLRKRKGSTLIKAILVAVALTFFGGFGLMGYCRFREGSREKEANTAASVNDSVITRQQLLRAIQRANNMRRAAPQTEAEALKQREEILDTLINQELVLREAIRTGIEVSGEEVQQYIAQIIQKDGVFDPRLYQAILKQNNMSESEFENDIRNRLIISKMSEIVSSGAVVTDDDVYQA